MLRDAGRDDGLVTAQRFTPLFQPLLGTAAAPGHVCLTPLDAGRDEPLVGELVPVHILRPGQARAPGRRGQVREAPITDLAKAALTWHEPPTLTEIDAGRPGDPQDLRTLPPGLDPLTTTLDALASHQVENPARPGDATADSLDLAQNDRRIEQLTRRLVSTVLQRVPPRLLSPSPHVVPLVRKQTVGCPFPRQSAQAETGADSWILAAAGFPLAGVENGDAIRVLLGSCVTAALAQ